MTPTVKSPAWPATKPWTATQPFPVRIVPADLVRGLRP